jgi:hypothetical protein
VNNRPLFIRPRCENSLYVALSRSSGRLVVFHDYHQATQAALASLCSSPHLAPDRLRIEVCRHMPTQIAPTKARAACTVGMRELLLAMDPRQIDRFACTFEHTEHSGALVEDVYIGERDTSVDPEEDRRPERCDTMDSPLQLPLEGTFGRRFDVVGQVGHGPVTLFALAGATIVAMVEFHLLRQCPERFHDKLRQSTSGFISTLYTECLGRLAVLGEYTGDRRTLWQYIQIMAALCAAYDACTGYYDKIFEIASFSLFACPPIVQRIDSILDHLERHCPSLCCVDASFYQYKSINLKVATILTEDEIQEMVDVGRPPPRVIRVRMAPTIVHPACTILFSSTPAIQPEDIIHAGLFGAFRHYTSVHLMNTCTGQHLEVHIPPETRRPVQGATPILLPGSPVQGATPIPIPGATPPPSPTEILHQIVHNNVYRNPTMSDHDFVDTYGTKQKREGVRVRGGGRHEKDEAVISLSSL